MEIIEVLSYFVNLDKNILEVNFRTNSDSEEFVRIDTIDYNIIEEYGYDLETESFDFFDLEEDEEFENKPGDVELDEESLLSFLNEYYAVNPHVLPSSEIL